MIRILGIDPGLQRTGWGVIAAGNGRLSWLAHGVVASTASRSTAERLVEIEEGLSKVLADWAPEEAAVEETFVNKNPVSTLKLGLARGIALYVPAKAGLPVSEYPANLIKKSVVGAGHADKTQVQMMVETLLPAARIAEKGKGSADAADALAVAICHAHHAQTRRLVGGVMAGGAR